ncbi:MAG TPA: PH domain-containing protein [Candidatus Saccharimonadales bacterium]|nr:PH domain-containing protein [Candidatus Saccharimonadales bacterium]
MVKSKQTDEANEEQQAYNGPTKYFTDQFDDENVLFVFHKHPIVMRKGLIICMLAWLIGPVFTLSLTYLHPNKPPNITFFGISLILSIILGMILILPSWVGWHFSVFIMTDQRFIQITQKGFFHRAVADLRLSQIQSVNYEVSGLQETLLGFGTIKMQTYVGDLTIHEVHHPAKIQKRILNILRDEGVDASSYPAVKSTAPNKVHEETEEAQEA